MSLGHARETLANWIADHNQERPHNGIGNLPPALQAKLSAPGTQRAIRARLKPRLSSSADASRGSAQLVSPVRVADTIERD